jgi:hypothetical protein
LVSNSLGEFVSDQLAALGWSRARLVVLSGLDPFELEAILDSPVLDQWPRPEVLLGLARVFQLPVRELVMHAAEGCGLAVRAAAPDVHTLSLTSNEELMREVRRRLALGAATGGYLTSPNQYSAGSGAAPA